MDWLVAFISITVLSASLYGLYHLMNWEEARGKRLTWKEVFSFITKGTIQ